jgi:hypothetical protein
VASDVIARYEVKLARLKQDCDAAEREAADARRELRELKQRYETDEKEWRGRCLNFCQLLIVREV